MLPVNNPFLGAVTLWLLMTQDTLICDNARPAYSPTIVTTATRPSPLSGLSKRPRISDCLSHLGPEIVAVTDNRRYQVWVHGWSAVSCAGDSAATAAACASGHCRLRDDPHHGWCGQVPGLADQGPGRTLALACQAASGLDLRALSTGEQEPWPMIAVCPSKGDSAALLAADRLHPHAVTEALPGAFPLRLARALGLRLIQPLATVAACSTGLYGIINAADHIDRCGGVALAGAVDASLQGLLLAGFDRMGVRCSQAPQAFAGHPTGFAPAEGAGLLVLSTQPGPWRLVGGVRLGDASHPTECQDRAVLRQCLERLWSLVPEPDLIIPHATGTRNGDAFEQAGLDDGPWAKAPRWLCKPAIGHCLGASGAVELAAALNSSAQRLWKISLGFGGHVAAVALQRG